MNDLELMAKLSRTTPSKIVLVVIDGLGGLPHPDTGKTELETARTPYMDMLASRGSCGLANPVMTGITPGSAPAHLALFGYDPLRYVIGRGVLEALGIDFDLEPGDVAARGNLCSLTPEGLILDRRAGRISTEEASLLCKLLDGLEIEGVKISVRPVKEHRVVVVFRGEGLGGEVSDSDPQLTGVPPQEVVALSQRARLLAKVANAFLEETRRILGPYYPANMLLLRGFSERPDIISMRKVYHLNPAAIASYPMYRGLAKVVGMRVLKTGPELSDELTTLEQHYHDFDFFFLHVKACDSAGEDGNFEQKVKVLEGVDAELRRLDLLSPDVIVVTGDHSTPALLKGHSWHPVPLLVTSPWCRPERISKFGESTCRRGWLGHIPSVDIMPLAMACALKLAKFGA